MKSFRFSRGASSSCACLREGGRSFCLSAWKKKEEPSLDAPRGNVGEKGPGPVPAKSNVIRKDYFPI